MNALIIAAHGSRKKESEQEVAALAEKLAKRSGGILDLVAHGFLQFCGPDLEAVIAETVEKGATTISIFPLFVSAGSHVRSDIPELIAQARERHPGVNFTVTRHLAVIESIQDLILNEVLSR